MNLQICFYFSKKIKKLPTKINGVNSIIADKIEQERK